MQNVGVIGLGKVGLPLALAISQGHFNVIGLDISEELVTNLNCGQIPNHISEPGLKDLLKNSLNSKKFTASTDISRSLFDCEIVVVIVPLKLNLDGTPDFKDLDLVTGQIATSTNPGTLVIYETTLPIGTTRGRFLPILARGMGIPISEVMASFSPERIFSGAYLKTLATIPKVVGGANLKSAHAAADFYRNFIKELPDCPVDGPKIQIVSNSDTAEFIKIAETTYRDVNIALANTFAMHATENELDFTEIREACNQNAFSHLHKPGIWVGGHCIPVYPMLYLSSDPSARIVQTAREINEGMPKYYLSEISERIGSLDGCVVLIKGITYRGDVKELYASGVFVIKNELSELGAKVIVEDPLYSDKELVELGFDVYDSSTHKPEVVVFQSDHSEYLEFDPNSMPSVKLFVDGRSYVRKFKFQDSRFMSLGSSSNTYAPHIDQA